MTVGKRDNMRSHLKVFFDFDERTEMLTDAERGRLLLAMVRYAKSGELPDLKGNERFLWPVFKGDIDRDAAAYEAHVQNGRLGGRPENQTKPNETKRNLTKPNETKPNLNLQDRRQKTEDEEEDEDEEKRTTRTARRFSAPTVEDVSAYCRERGNRVNAQAFVDFYASKGWKVGGQPMKDWQAAVRTWEQRDNYAQPARMKVTGAAAYAQRDYTEEDLDSVSVDLIEEARALKAAGG